MRYSSALDTQSCYTILKATDGEKHMRIVLLLSIILLTITIPLVSAQDDITFGEVMSGEITADQPTFEYTFDGVEGDIIYAYMYTPNGDLTPAMRLTALGGVVVAEATDNDSLGAFLGPITLEGSLTYTLIVTHPDWEAESTGAFELVLDRVNPIVLEPGVTSDGNLPRAGLPTFFSYTGAADDVIRYTTTGTNLGIAVIGPNGETLLRDGLYDNPGSLFNVLPQDGDYTILLQTANTGGTDFSITVRPLDVPQLAEGAPVTGTGEEAAGPVVFSFQSDGGKLLALNAAVAGADGQSLAIFGGERFCCEIIRDYGSGPNGNPRIDPFIVPATGTYYAVLWFDLYSEDNASLDYEVSLSASTLISLSLGAEINDIITPESGIKSYSYSAQAGETLRITLTQTGGDGWPLIRVFSPETQILDFQSHSINSISFELVFPVEGMYRFEIGNSNDEPTAVEFSLRVG
jgi:hypothetical protein